LVFGGLAFIIGIPSALSFNLMKDFTLFGLNFFDLANYLSANIMLPLGGLLLAIFVGYVWGIDKAFSELKNGAEKLFRKSKLRVKIWAILLKYLAPVLIFLVLLQSLGILQKLLGLFS